ncbi:unnamed protein product, partial [Trichogramma brassicae]
MSRRISGERKGKDQGRHPPDSVSVNVSRKHATVLHNVLRSAQMLLADWVLDYR